MQVTLLEAARLTGQSKRTLQRHVVAGRISVSKDNSNKTLVDTSELLRVYGPFKDKGGDNKEGDMSNAVASTDNPNDTVTTELQAALNASHAEVESLRQLLNEKQDHIDTLKQALKLIEFSRPAQPEPAPQPQKRSFLTRLFGG